MRILASTLLTIGLQLTLGTLVFVAFAGFSPGAPRGLDPARRRRLAVRARAAAEMPRSLPLAVASGLAGAALLVLLGETPPTRLIDTGFAILALVGAIPTTAAFLIHAAARREAAGRLRVARRQVRFGGLLMFWGIVALLVGYAAGLLLRPGSLPALLDGPPVIVGFLGAGVLAMLGAAFVALLAGLSGKPRPSGGFAVCLYLCGLAGLSGSAGAL